MRRTQASDGCRAQVARLKNSLSVEQPIAGDELRAIKKGFWSPAMTACPGCSCPSARRKLTRQAVNYIVCQAGEKANLGRVWPLMLRHSCGHYLADKGTDFRTMQDYPRPQ